MRIIARMNVGGPALQAATLLRGLPPDRYDQRLYAGFAEPGEADFITLRADDLQVRRVPALGRRIRPADDARALLALAGAIRQFRPHIVHTHTAKAGTLGRAAAVLGRAPARVHTFHGHLLHGYFPAATTRVVVAAERALARVSDRLVAVGGRVRDDLLAAGVGHPGQYVVVPPGTALRPLPDRQAARLALGVPPDCPVVAYVGRLTRIKRPDRLLAVARQVIRSVPGTRLLVCGDGDLAAEVGAAAAGLGGAVTLLGWRPDVETVYAAADLALLTSDNEGMPVSLIEAGLAGVPAVAADVGSVAEVVQDASTGLLARGTEELAGAVIRLLRDDALRLRLGSGARAWTQQQFGAQRLVADISDVYDSIAAERGWWPGGVRQRAALRQRAAAR